MKREAWIDYTKAIGIILVVIGHMNYELGTVLQSEKIYQFIQQFHMPLFFFLTGYTLNHRYFSNPIRFIKKQLKRVYLPYLYLTAVLLLLHNQLVSWGIYPEESGRFSKGDLLKRLIVSMPTCNITERLGGMLWFLPALLVSTVIYVCIHAFLLKVMKNKMIRNLLLIAAVAVLLFVGSRTHLSRHLSTAMVAVFFVWLGDCAKKLDWKKFSVTVWIVIFVAGSIIVAVIAPGNDVLMVANEYKNFALFLLSSIAGIMGCCSIGMLLNCVREWKAMAYLGRHTMPVFCLHFICFLLCNLLFVKMTGSPFTEVQGFPTIIITRWTVFLGYLASAILLPLLLEACYTKIKMTVFKK